MLFCCQAVLSCMTLFTILGRTELPQQSIQSPPTTSQPDSKAKVVFDSFSDAVSNAQQFKVDVDVQSTLIDDNGKRFEGKTEYELTVRKPDCLRLWIRKGNRGPTIVSDGSRVLCSVLPTRKADIFIAKKNIADTISEAVIGKSNAFALQHHSLIVHDIVGGTLAKFFSSEIHNARVIPPQTVVDGEACFLVRFSMATMEVDAYFTERKPCLLLRLVIKSSVKNENLTIVENFRNWSLNPKVNDSAFRLIDPFDNKLR